jgi:hypothetical protein
MTTIDSPLFIPWDGPVESVLRGSDEDLLRELLGAMDVVRDGSIKLTKSGIPPKPLWNALNDRLLWQDPRSVLFDWDEVDQIRFIYSLAMELRLIQPDDERILRPGPGADAFFLSTPIRRGRQLRRAYTNVADWDERCDARNNQGHRHNFGQTFRRDFRLDVHDVRKALALALRQLSPDQWFVADALALTITDQQPDILISEDDDLPPVFPGEPEPEIRRLLQYWVFLAARFGWVDLARTPETDEDGSGQRLVRLNHYGLAVLDPDRDDQHDQLRDQLLQTRPFTILPTSEIVVYRHDGDFADEFLARRICEDVPLPSWDEPTVTCRLSRQSLQFALRYGADPDAIRNRLLQRSTAAVPPVVAQLVSEHLPTSAEVALQTGLSAVDLAPDTPTSTLQALQDAGFLVYERLILVPWARWDQFCQILDAEPEEAFDYPVDPNEPLAAFDGNRLSMRWPVLPIAQSELLDLLGLSGSPLSCNISEETLAHLTVQGWSTRAVAEALNALTAGQLPKRLRSELKP